MWKLVLSFALFHLSIYDRSDNVILIVDDCQLWYEVISSSSEEEGIFTISRRATPTFRKIMLIHGWIDPSYKLSTMSMTYPEILRVPHIFSSDLSSDDWTELPRNIFILRPDDYCSDMRFIHSYKFKLYEAIIHVTRDE